MIKPLPQIIGRDVLYQLRAEDAAEDAEPAFDVGQRPLPKWAPTLGSRAVVFAPKIDVHERVDGHVAGFRPMMAKIQSDGGFQKLASQSVRRQQGKTALGDIALSLAESKRGQALVFSLPLHEGTIGFSLRHRFELLENAFACETRRHFNAEVGRSGLGRQFPDKNSVRPVRRRTQLLDPPQLSIRADELTGDAPPAPGPR